jgi:tetratricopeptide (TPR) repeat protein
MSPTSPQATSASLGNLLREGFKLLNAGRVNEAAECCRKILSIRRDLPEGHFLVGLVALELKQTVNAIHAFGSVTKLKPDHGAAWANLARLFAQTGQSGRADQAIAKAAEFSDGNPVVLDLIGTVYGQLGDHAEAGRWNQMALDKVPDSIPFLVNQANNHIFFDRIEAADQLLQKVVERVPGHPNAHWLISGMRKAEDRRHIETIKSHIASGKYGPRGLAFLYYGLGKELEDVEDWDEAFEAFSKGAANRREILDYDESREEAMFEAFEATYTSEWLEAGEVGNPSHSPIFVVGQPRSGTTLIERIITAHSQVHSAGELQQFGQCVRRLADYAVPALYSPELAHGGASVDPKKLGGAYLQLTRKHQGDSPRFVDKLPPNYLYIPLILKALPNAKIVHLQRSPMDACFASFKQLFADAYPHSYEQGEMARHHARYFSLMQRYRDRFPGRFFDISYEATAADLEPNARALIDYLELPWEDACLEFHKQDSAVTTASAVQVRQPAHTRSVGRWRRYESQLKSMREALESAGIPLEF